MLQIDNQRNHAKRFLGLTLTLAALMTVTILVSGPVALAQVPTPSWAFTGNLNTGRFGHTATLLPGGKVLVVGGASFGPTNSSELYDPATGAWNITGSLNLPRIRFTATLLPNGKVLVAGGHTSSSPTPTNTAELYDPATGAWSLTGNMNKPRAWHSATLLENGKVLIVGGYGSDVLNSAELYDPETGMWTTTGILNQGRIAHTATLLQNGKVLVAGGTDSIFFAFTVNEEYGPGLISAELYDPSTGSWTATGRLNTGRWVHTATLLPNGNVLVAGGGSSDMGLLVDMPDTAELYSPTTGTWSYTGNLNHRAHHAAMLLPNGQVLVVGGEIYQGILNNAEIYDPGTGNWSSTANLNAPRYLHTATLLSNGKVLVVGGSNWSGVLPGAELYNSGASSTSNPIDDAQFFVRQHYLDFLNREPDAPGLAHWTGEINACNDPSQRQPAESLASCIERKRANTSAAFFFSPEFQNTGSFVLRVYWGTLGKLPNAQCPGVPSGLPSQCRPLYADYVAEVSQVAKGIVVNDQLDPNVINANKRAFIQQFVTKPAFKAIYDSLNSQQFVDKLFETTGINATATDRAALVDGLNGVNGQSATETRSSVVFKVVDGTQTIADGALVFNTRYGQAFYDQEFDTTFVFMEYVGYLHRNPDQAGYEHWLSKLKLYGNWADAEMVLAFILSPEYRLRFAQP